MAFPEPTNLTTIPLLLNYVNDVTGGYYGVGMIIALYFVVLITMMHRREYFVDAFIIAGWVSIIGSGITYFSMGLVNDLQFFILVIIAGLSLALGYLIKPSTP